MVKSFLDEQNMSNIFNCTGYKMADIEIVHAKDSYLYDTQNKQYIDFESGIWCTALGHNHPIINQTIQKQLKLISHIGYRYTTIALEEAAEQLLITTLFSDGKCVFLSSGSEAVEFGVQVIRRITGTPILLTLSDSYLGAYGSAGRKSHDEWYCFDWAICKTCPHQENCNPQCIYLKEIPTEKIGGFVFEPGNSSGLIKFPPAKLIENIVRLTRENNGLILVNEVTTGLGRTGLWYGYEHYNVQPDLIAMGKGLGNGYPVSAIAMKSEITDQLEKIGFCYAQSHQDDPMGCTIVKEVIRTIREEHLVERSKNVGKYFLHKLNKLCDQHNVIKEVRGRGLMIAVEFNNDPNILLDSVFHQLLKRGFIIGFKPVASLFRFYPPLTINEKDIDLFIENFNDILQEIKYKQGVTRSHRPGCGLPLNLMQ